MATKTPLTQHKLFGPPFRFGPHTVYNEKETSATMEGGSTVATTTKGADPAVMEAIEQRGSAVVFLDVALGDGDDAIALGRIKLELFVKDVSDSVL